MKRLLSSVCILTLSCTMAFGQNTPSTSKAAFQVKVDQLDHDLTQNNLTQAHTDYTQLKSMMQTHLGETKTKVAQLTNQTDIQSQMTILRTQQVIYTDIVQMENDLVTNRQAIHTKFEDFVANY